MTKRCRRVACKKAALWECRTCGAMCCEHMCSLKTGKTASCSKCQAQNEAGRDLARRLGWDAAANNTSFDEDREQIAERYGFAAWADMPSKLKADAIRAFVAGKREE